MSTSASSLQEKILSLHLDPSLYTPIFACNIDLTATFRMHPEAFEELVNYMEKHVKEYCVVLDDSSTMWVPMDYIRFIYMGDKAFQKRLGRFVNGLTARDCRVITEEQALDLQLRNIGNHFLSWDMTTCFFMHEGRSTLLTKKENTKVEEAGFVEEKDKEKEELLTEAEEASMALVLLQSGTFDEDMEGTLEGDQALDLVPEFDIRRLLQIVVDGSEYLFLDDICKSLGLREDEALSALAQAASVEEEPQNTNLMPLRTKLSFPHTPLQNELELISGSHMRSIEDTVVSGLMAIRNVEEEYSLVPDTAFQSPRPLLVGSNIADRGGSINIAAPHIEEADELTLSAIQIDSFAGRKGGVREKSSGRDTSLWHYLQCFNSQVLRVVHLEYSLEGAAELIKCKALSVSLCADPLTQNANKCILVGRQAALYTFAGKYEGQVLSKCALAMSKGVADPLAIASTIGQQTVIDNRRADAIRALLQNM